MGRKIPGRKHRGIRDPEKQAALRFNSIKDKINAPPSDPDDQQITKTLQRIIDLKSKVKNGDFSRRRKKKLKNKENNNTDIAEDITSIPKNRGEKIIPVFKQNPGETDRAFISRMNKICMDVTKETKFEEKYGVEIIRNESGEVENVVRRPKDELELMMKKIRKEKQQKKKKKKKTDKEKGPRLNKSQKWQQKKKDKKLKKKLKNVDEFENYKDKVKFGETVHAPPTLVTPRRVEKLQIAPRPGKKALLLKSVIEPNKLFDSNVAKSANDSLRKTSNKTIDKKGKRKDLPNALRRQLDTQQTEIISAYKLLKAKKYVNH